MLGAFEGFTEPLKLSKRRCTRSPMSRGSPSQGGGPAGLSPLRLRLQLGDGAAASTSESLPPSPPSAGLSPPSAQEPLLALAMPPPWEPDPPRASESLPTPDALGVSAARLADWEGSGEGAFV